MLLLERKILLYDLNYCGFMVDVASAIAIATGFVLGMGHSFDPDHVVAVSTLLCKNTSLRKSIVSATAWGTGHSIVLFAVGLLVLAVRVEIPSGAMSIFQLAAGVLLIVLGIWVIRPFITGKLRLRNPKGKLDEQMDIHDQTHDHAGHDHAHLYKSLFTGALQGLGGSAAIMLVVLTTVESATLGLVYILLFGLGVIVGMISIAFVVSSILTYTVSHLERVHEKILAVTGTISICFGVFIVIQYFLQLPL